VDEPAATSSTELVEDLFRREYAHLVSALTRALGPSNIPLVEDVVHDALLSAMHAWRFGLPRDPKAWIIRAAHNRAVDIIRRERRHRALLPELATTAALTDTIEVALAPSVDGANQVAMMFAVCDPAVTRETQVTLILRWLCGLSPKEIGQAFLVGTPTINRRLHRGRARLRRLGALPDVDRLTDIEARRTSVLQALYLLFSEGYHGSNPQDPVRPFLCTDALRLTVLLLEDGATTHADVHALAALICFNTARLGTRVDEQGVFVPLEDQDRTRWDRRLIERGLAHLARSATGDHMSRWHLEAGIACEHAIAPSVRETDWDRIVVLYDLLVQQSPSPVVALNRALALAERDGVDAGSRALMELAGDRKLATYPFYWAARADLERRAERPAAARSSYERAIAFSRSAAERVSYERRLELLDAS
jgi:RNA polymerase sigma factor (sigma-70 family)